MADGKSDSKIEKTIEAIVSKFRRFDVNGDGVINENELTQVLEHMDPAFWSSSNVFRLMHEMDANHDGQIAYDEFVRWCLTHVDSPKKSGEQKERRKRRSSVERKFGKIPAGKFEGSSMVMEKAEAARAAIRPEEIEEVLGPMRGSEPQGAAVILDALIEMMRGVDPIVKPMCTPSGMTGSRFFLSPKTTTPIAAADGGRLLALDPGSPSDSRRLRRLQTTLLGYNAWKQLVHDRDAFLDSLRNLSTAVSGGLIPSRNMNRAHARLCIESDNEEGEVVQEADLARRSPVRVISLLCIFVESLIEYADMTDVGSPLGDSMRLVDHGSQRVNASQVDEEHPTLTLPKLSASRGAHLSTEASSPITLPKLSASPDAPPSAETSGSPAAESMDVLT